MNIIKAEDLFLHRATVIIPGITAYHRFRPWNIIDHSWVMVEIQMLTQYIKPGALSNHFVFFEALHNK